MKPLRMLLPGALFLILAAGVGCNQADNSKSPALGLAELAKAKEGRGGEQPADEEANKGKQLKEPPTERKIIFSADIRLGVPDFIKAERDLDQLLQTHNAYTAQVELSGSAGGTRQGSWRIRVPAAKFKEFGEAVKKLGELMRYTSDAKEVTEEYYDLQIRVKNKEAELESLRKIFDKGSGKTEDVLAVQREVSRAERELEQMKGRQRVLDNLIELTTITVHMQERGTFTPTEPTAFSAKLGDTFSGSIDLLIGVGKALVLAAVAVAPWLPGLAILAAVVWLVTRRHKVAATPAPASGGPEVKGN